MARKMVSSWAKKNFIYWFADHYEISDEAYDLLEEIVENEDLLSRMHVTEDGTLLKPLLVISTANTGMPSLLLQSFDRDLHQSYDILNYLWQLENKPFYLTLYFFDRNQCKPYLAVAENPPSLLEPEKANALRFDFELKLCLEEMRKAEQRRQLMIEIDKVLETKEKRRFLQLVRKLKRIK